MNRNVNGMPLDTVLCVTCVQGTYPSPDCSRCLPCDSHEYNGHVNCMCPSATHVRLRDHCLRKDEVVDWPNVRSTYLMKFRSENVDSHYLRNELQVAVHLCKVVPLASIAPKGKKKNDCNKSSSFRGRTRRLANVCPTCAS